MKFLIITGMSGAGKTVALKTMEDMGYFCVDNLPVFLMPQFAELSFREDSEKKVALGIDTRSGNGFNELKDALNQIKSKGIKYEVFFLDASDEVLIKRYKETRRNHPLSPNGRIEDGINKEREAVSWLRDEADYIIDTSNLISRELKTQLEKILTNEKSDYRSMVISIMSFGFKYGIPKDADLLFDVRFLPNPFYVDSLKEKNGLDTKVCEYVKRGGLAEEFLQKISDLTDFLLPEYIKEGKSQIVIAFGCTGGKHRSVTIAESLYKNLVNTDEYIVNIIHRDISR